MDKITWEFAASTFLHCNSHSQTRMRLCSVHLLTLYTLKDQHESVQRILSYTVTLIAKITWEFAASTFLHCNSHSQTRMRLCSVHLLTLYTLKDQHESVQRILSYTVTLIAKITWDFAASTFLHCNSHSQNHMRVCSVHLFLRCKVSG